MHVSFILFIVFSKYFGKLMIANNNHTVQDIYLVIRAKTTGASIILFLVF